MVKFVKVRGKTLFPVYILSDNEYQLAGFQGFKVIPDFYGLWFPGSHEKKFHMNNVGADLLAIGLDLIGNEHYSIVSSHIWRPNGTCPFSGDHVLECHLKFLDSFPVGEVIYLQNSVDAKEDPRLALNS